MSGPIGTASVRQTGPVSRPSSMRMMAGRGRGVAGHDRTRNRRRPAPARQGRGVQVEAARARGLQHRLGQDQTVGDDHAHVRPEVGERLLLGGVLQRPRRDDREARALGIEVDRRLALAHAAAGRPGRARVDGCHLVARRQQRRQRRHGEVGGAHEDDAHVGRFLVEGSGQ